MAEPNPNVEMSDQNLGFQKCPKLSQLTRGLIPNQSLDVRKTGICLATTCLLPAFKQLRL